MQCGYGCVSGSHSTSTASSTAAAAADSVNMGLACLQALVAEDNFEELQFQLYIKEIQRLNPSLREGCLFVDGLYELVCSRLPVQVGRDSNLRNSARDLLTLHSSDLLLLQKYWHKPHDPDEYTAYLTVATSFMHHIFTKFGPQGISELLRQLDYTVDDPLTENFRFGGQDILQLEFRWKKFVEAEVNANFRLSVLGMLHMLFTRYLLSYWMHLLIVLLLILADVGLEFLYSVAFAELIGLGFSLGSIDYSQLFQWVGILIVTLVVRFSVLLVSAGVLVTMAVSVSNRLRRALSSRLCAVTPLFLTDHSASSLLTTFSQDVNVVEKIVSHGLRAIVVAMALVTVCFIYCAVILWPLSIYLTGLFILSQIFNNLVSMRLSIYLFAKGQATNKLCDILKEQIDGFLVNHMYRLSRLWDGQLQEVIRSFYTTQARKALFFTSFCGFFQQMVPNVSIATMLFGIILLSREGYTDFTTGISVFLFYIRVSVGLTAAASIFPELQTACTAMGRINALLNNKSHEIKEDDLADDKTGSMASNFEEPPPDDDSDVPSLPIEFKGVCFSYKMSAAHWNLYNISLTIKAGEKVVIVGTTGSGKSTLLMLAMQLYKPTVGQVTLGGGKSAFYNGQPKISTTFQKNHMFNMSLRENIRLGNLAASNEEVKEAARKADIHDWITTLARGYDTPVQSGGNSLSEGQRQRIAIARMLVAKSPICLLDEVTSALDPLTEARVFEKLMEVTRGRTVLAVTHKLEHAKRFDRIVVLSHGRVKEVGSHSGLLTNRGTYWRMWNNDMAISPGRPVSIPRRRSSEASQMRETPLQPNLTILPLSSPGHVPGAYYTLPTPIFLPLQPLMETGESRSMTSQNSSGAVFLPAITVPRSTGNVSPKDAESAAGQSGGEHSNLTRRASTPIVTHPEMPLPTDGNDALELTGASDSHYLSLQPLSHVHVEYIATDQEPAERATALGPVECTPIASKSLDIVEEPYHSALASVCEHSYDMNQTLPPRVSTSQRRTGAALRRHSTLRVHSGIAPAATDEPLGSQLERILNDNSLASLASFFDIELGTLLAQENSERQEEGGGGGGRGRGERGTGRDVQPQVIVHC